jgi:hypothetical protein
MRRYILAFVLILTTAVSAQAAPISYFATLSGGAENPPNASPAIGSALVIIDAQAHTMFIDVTFSGLLGTTTVAHIHCCIAPPGNAGVATTTPTFPGFPVGVTSGTYTNSFNMTLLSSFNPPFVTANGGTAASAEAALFAGIANGMAYFNIHTSMFPGGEIRGFLQPVAVPEPATGGLLLLGLSSLVARARRRRRA